MVKNNISTKDFDFFSHVINLDWALQLISSTKGEIRYISNLRSSYRKHSNGISTTMLSKSNFRTMKLLFLFDCFNRFSK